MKRWKKGKGRRLVTAMAFFMALCLCVSFAPAWGEGENDPGVTTQQPAPPEPPAEKPSAPNPPPEPPPSQEGGQEGGAEGGAETPPDPAGPPPAQEEQTPTPEPNQEEQTPTPDPNLQETTPDPSASPAPEAGDPAGEKKIYTVLFIDWQGAVYSSAVVKEGSAILAPSGTPERAGYRFKGWYVPGEEEMVPFGFGTPAGGAGPEIKIYAQYQKEKSGGQGNGGDVPEGGVVSGGESIPPPVPPKKVTEAELFKGLAEGKMLPETIVALLEEGLVDGQTVQGLLDREELSPEMRGALNDLLGDKLQAGGENEEPTPTPPAEAPTPEPPEGETPEDGGLPEGTVEPLPTEEELPPGGQAPGAPPARMVTIHSSLAGKTQVPSGTRMVLMASVSGFDGLTPQYQWQCSTGGGWENIAGATGSTLTVELTEKNEGWLWRVVVTALEDANASPPQAPPEETIPEENTSQGPSIDPPADNPEPPPPAEPPKAPEKAPEKPEQPEAKPPAAEDGAADPQAQQ